MDIMEEKNSTELSKVEPKKIFVKINGQDREIKFNFRAWAVLQEEYDGLNNFDKLQSDMEKKPFTTLPHLIWIALVDKEGLNEEHILDDYGLGDVEELSKKIEYAMSYSLPESKKKSTAPKKR
jgi:hypothetical protein